MPVVRCGAEGGHVLRDSRGDGGRLHGAGVGSTHPQVFATFTAPSFGAVHGARRHGYRMEVCHPRRGRCPHGVRLGCLERHHPDDARVGTPICAECFDYEGQVLWNRFAPVLWQRTTIYLPRILARLAGMKLKELREVIRKPEFAKVAEYQQRGALHFHAIVRLDGVGPDGAITAPPSVFTTELLAEAIRQTVEAVSVHPRELPAGRTSLRWGSELHVRAIRQGGPEDLTSEAVAAYIAKYATKGSEALAMDGELTPHVSRLVATARELDACPEFGGLRLDGAALELGFRGHFATKSRRYSTTLTAKRKQRIEFARRSKADGGELLDAWGRPEDEDQVVVEADWRFAGQGYKTGGEAWLALSAAAWAREMKRTAKEEIRAGRGSVIEAA